MGDLAKEKILFDQPKLFLTQNGKQVPKSYMALFVCFTSKAIHLELATGFSAQPCTASLRRKCSRRVVRARMYIVNELNFV